MNAKSQPDFDFIAAIAAFRDLRKANGNPEPGARLGVALGGRKWYRQLTEKVRQHSCGQQLLSDKVCMGELLNNWEQLRQLPEGSVGREYLRWAEAEQLTVKGLEEAVAPAFEQMPTEEQEYVRNRTRDLHDLFHVLTGYGRDSGGETALLAFTAEQHNNKSMNFLSWLGFFHALFQRRYDIIRLRRHARERAAQARFLLVEPWEELLARPLEDVRAEMNLLPTPNYTPFNLRQ